jgi:hypothetical protein
MADTQEKVKEAFEAGKAQTKETFEAGKAKTKEDVTDKSPEW